MPVMRLCTTPHFATKKCHKWHFCDVKLASSSKKRANRHSHVSAVCCYLTHDKGYSGFGSSYFLVVKGVKELSSYVVKTDAKSWPWVAV